MWKVQLETTKLKSAGVGKEKPEIWVDERTGRKFPMSHEEVQRLKTTPPAELTPEQMEIVAGFNSGKIKLGVPTKETETPMTAREKADREAKNRERLAEIANIVSMAGTSPEDPPLNSDEINTYVAEANEVLLPESATYVYARVPESTKWKGLRKVPPKMLQWPLPTVEREGNIFSQLTVGEIRARAKQRGVSFEEQLRLVFQHAAVNKIGVGNE